MAISDAFEELTRHWPRLAAQLTDDQITTIRRALAALVHGVAWDPTEVFATALADQPDDHPVWQALASTGTRRQDTPTPSLEVAAVQLRLTIELAEQRGGSRLVDEAAEIEREAEDRILLAPMTEAAMPAIWPSGSIANALRLPKTKPTETKTQVAQAKNTQTFIMPMSQRAKPAEEVNTIPTRAVLIMMRMPNFRTSLALTTLAGMEISAEAAKNSGKVSARSKVSA